MTVTVTEMMECLQAAEPQSVIDIQHCRIKHLGAVSHNLDITWRLGVYCHKERIYFPVKDMEPIQKAADKAKQFFAKVHNYERKHR